MRLKNPVCPNFLDTSELQFVSLHHAMDSVFRCYWTKGATAVSKSHEAFSNEEVDQLWVSGSLSHGLIVSIFFRMGKKICIRGGEEHRNLKLSQFRREEDPPRYIYKELASNNRAGGLAQLRVKNKVVPINAVPVYILDLYFSILPKEAFKRDVFYLQPVAKVCSEDCPWFSTTPIGKNTLAKMVKYISTDFGIAGKK